MQTPHTCLTSLDIEKSDMLNLVFQYHYMLIFAQFGPNDVITPILGYNSCRDELISIQFSHFKRFWCPPSLFDVKKIVWAVLEKNNQVKGRSNASLTYGEAIDIDGIFHHAKYCRSRFWISWQSLFSSHTYIPAHIPEHFYRTALGDPISNLYDLPSYEAILNQQAY